MKNRAIAAFTNPEHKGFLRDLFPTARYENCTLVSSSAILSQQLRQQDYDVVIIIAPLTDEYGIRTAIQVAAGFKTDVLLLVPADHYDQAAYMCMEASVYVLSLPVNRQSAWQALQFMEKARAEINRIERQLKKTRDKYQELQVVSRCKLMLMQNYRWSEEKAHHYIEKTAMDHSITKMMVAKVLLDKMQGAKHA